MTARKREPAFTPFSDDATVKTFGNFSVENGTQRIALHGSLDLTRDQAGLARARALKAVLDAVVRALEGEPLPDAVAEDPEATVAKANPFA